jgi:hypothetical protein
VLLFYIEPALGSAALGPAWLAICADCRFGGGDRAGNGHDARLFAVAAGVAWFFWRKGGGQAVLGTIVVGMAVYLPLHLGLGW